MDNIEAEAQKYYEILRNEYESECEYYKSKFDYDVWHYLTSGSGLAAYLIDVNTYDSQLDELIARKVLKALVICYKQSFSLLSKAEQDEFVMNLNCSGALDWIDWGTSIRSAFLKESSEDEDDPFQNRKALLVAVMKLIKDLTGENLME